MARILICEPHEDVRRLLERMVARLGHQPVVAEVTAAAEQLTSADVLVVETTSPVGTALAQAACIAVPSLPIVCASVTTPPGELEELGVVFVATLVKPFTMGQFSDAINHALRVRRRCVKSNHHEDQDAA